MGKLETIIVPVTSFRQNCTILFDDDSKKGVVIDPGGDISRIIDAIDTHHVKIENIWLTHGHIDHAGGALNLKEALGVNIVGSHEADKFLLDNLEAIADDYHMSGVRNVTPDRWLKDGDVVSVGDHHFEVLHCPGHAPGHVVYFNRLAEFAHVGDVLFRGAVGRSDLAGGDHAALIRSIKMKLLPLGDHIKFICGHGPGGRFGEERQTNPFLIN